MVKLTAQGCERILKKPIKKSEPLTSPEELFDHYLQDTSATNTPSRRFLLILILCFAGFLRIDELLSTTMKFVHIDREYMTITLPKCKNDQLREGNVVYIARTRSEYCPVTFVENFCAETGLSLLNEDSFLLPRIIRIKKGYKAHQTLGISYTTARETFVKHVRAVYGTVLKYTLHGLRAGGASEAASNGIDGRSISKHGRWKTQKARNAYIHDSVANRLRVTRSLGL